jgi:PAS domain S-box-containing protein
MVEDSQTDSFLLKYELEAGGYELELERVETWEGMKAALEHGTWDLVLADYDLPQFTGMAALRLLQETGLDLPFIVVSGRIGEETAVMMMKAGAHDYIMKNNLARLLPAVEREIREARVRQERRWTEKALEKSEAMYRRIVETANEGIWVMNEKYLTTFVNPRMTEILGFTIEELMGRPVTEFMFAEDLAAHRERMASRQEGKGDRYEQRFRRKDGRERWLLVSAAPLKDPEGRFAGSFGMFTDITERKQAEAALKAAYTKLETLWSIASLDNADLKTICDHILASIVKMTFSQYGFYGFIDENESGMTIYTWSGEAMKDCSVIDKPRHFPIAEAGVWAEAIRRRTQFILNHYAAGHAAKKGLPEGHTPLTNLLVVPFFHHGKIVSVAAVANKAEDYGQDDVSQITTFLTGIQAITEHRRAEEALRENEEKFRQMAENIDEVFFVQTVDMETMLYINPAYEKVWGRSCESLYHDACSWFECIHPEDRDRISAALARKMETGTFDAEYRILRPDGALRWIWSRTFPIYNAKGQIYRVAGTAVDITDRKVAEEKIRESENKYRTVVETLQEGIWVIDKENNTTFVNPRMAEMLGYTVEEMQGKPLFAFMDEQGVAIARQNVERRKQKIQERHEFEFIRKDGRRVLVSLETGPILDAQGNYVGAIAGVTDITEQKKIEKEMSRYREELHHAQRVAAVGEMASSLAHELNQPLCSIQSHAEACVKILEMGKGEAGDLQAAAREIAAQAQRAGNIVRQVKDFTRKNEPQRTAVALNHIIQNAVRLAEPSIKQNDVRLELKLSEPVPQVLADAIQIEQVVLNLIQNASDAMTERDGGERTLFIGTQPEETNPGQVRVWVRDSGKGISQENLPRIMESFFTTKPEGLGMGLPICRSIIENHKGRFWFYSNTDRGMTFCFTLPVVEDNP